MQRPQPSTINLSFSLSPSTIYMISANGSHEQNGSCDIASPLSLRFAELHQKMTSDIVLTPAHSFLPNWVGRCPAIGRAEASCTKAFRMYCDMRFRFGVTTPVFMKSYLTDDILKVVPPDVLYYIDKELLVPLHTLQLSEHCNFSIYSRYNVSGTFS